MLHVIFPTTGSTGYFPSDYVEQMVAQQPMMTNAPPQQVQRTTNMGGSQQQTPGQMASINNQISPSQQPYPPMMSNVPVQLMQGQHQQQKQQIHLQQQQISSQISSVPANQMQRPSASTSGSNNLSARAKFNFAGDGPNQMKLTAGEIVEIISRGAPGGWCTGIRGAFPTDYVEIINSASNNQSITSVMPTLSAMTTNGASVKKHLGGLDSGLNISLGTDLASTQIGTDNNVSRASSNNDSGKLRAQMPSNIKLNTNSSLLDMTLSESNAPIDLLSDMNGGNPFGIESANSSFSGSFSGSNSGGLSVPVLNTNKSQSQSRALDSANSSLKEFDLYNGIAIPSASVGTGASKGGMTSLLDLDDSVDYLQPQKIDTLKPTNFMSSGMQNSRPVNNIDILDSLILSADSIAIDKFPQSSMNSSFTNINSSYSATNKVLSPFSSLDGLDSSSIDILDMSNIPKAVSRSSSDFMTMSSTTNASDMITYNMSGGSLMTNTNTNINTMSTNKVVMSSNDSSKDNKNDLKPPPVAARIIPPVVYARAIYSRGAEGPTELTLESGDFILVETKESEWWYGSIVHTDNNKNRNKNKTSAGFFPGNYVEFVDRETVTLYLSNVEESCDASPVTNLNLLTGIGGNNKNKNQGNSFPSDISSMFNATASRASTLLLPDARDMTRHTTSTAKFSSTFVCSTAVGENIPIWKHPVFSDLFVDYYVPHPSLIPPILPGDARAARVDNNRTIKKMSKSLKFVCLALQKARDSFINSRSKMSTEEDIRNERLSQVLLHNIGVFTDAFKLSEKIPVNTGNLLFLPFLISQFKI